MESESSAATRYEEQALIDYYAKSATAPPDLSTSGEGNGPLAPITAEQFRSTLLEFCFAARNVLTPSTPAAARNDGDHITLTFLSDDTEWMFQLANSYRDILSPRGSKFSAGVFLRKDHDKDLSDPESGDLSAMLIDDREFTNLSASCDRKVGALSVQFTGGYSSLLLADEDGLHQRLGTESERWNCLIETNSDPIEEIRVPMADLERISIKNLPVRRQFDDAKLLWKDKLLQELQHEHHKGPGNFSQDLLERLLDDTLFIRARAALGQ